MTKDDLVRQNGELLDILELVMEVIYGNEEERGIYDCLPSYYEGVWDKQLDDIEAAIETAKENMRGHRRSNK
jgi:alpha-mannosidase